MNKIIKGFMCLCLFGILNSEGSAQKLNDGLSASGSVIINSYSSGGSGELGFPLYSGKKGSLRNSIVLTGLSLNKEGGDVFLGNKLSYGGFNLQSNMRPYSFLEGGWGFLTQTAYFQGGGGVDFYFDQKSAFFAEVGGGAFIKEKQASGFAHINLGFRAYW